MDDALNDPISVPGEPMAGAGSSFPVVASIAPVVAAVVIWLLTRSPFVLVFAALGPIVAIAGVVDNRWSTRRRLRTETAAYRVELAALTELVDKRHEDERRIRRSEAVGARRVLDAAEENSSATGFARWRVPSRRQTTVTIGRGAQRSGVKVDGPPGEETTRVKRLAATLTDVPIELDAAAGIGIVGSVMLCRAFARGLLVQLCSAASPDTLALVEVPDGWQWTDQLPHRRSNAGAHVVRLVERADAERPQAHADPSDILIVLADRVDVVPTRCSHLIEFTGVSTALLHLTTETGRPHATEITVELVSEVEAARFAGELAAHAVRAGVGGAGASLPTSVALAELPVHGTPGSSSSLSAVIGTSGKAPVLVDIVADGPHAIVGGTTGSGKSELLVTWVTSLTDRYPPGAVNLLLVDFKGGAAFAPLLRLPHVVGVVTDLDAAAAARALESLRAEVRFRERSLRDADARDIADVPTLPRLVIVVDEFAAMLDGYPDLHALFVDVAARGRSLGMHLILCTQRPAGVVRDSLLANCGLRMSLRVNNRADSTAILGSDAAALLPPSVPGRLALARPDGTVIIQVASTSESDLDRAADRWSVPEPLRKPWLDPLPSLVQREMLTDASDGIRLGLADHPGEQRQETALWRPESDGSLLVIGTARTGKTTLLDTVEAEAERLGTGVLERIGTDPELAWDIVHLLAGGLGARTADSRPVLLLIDDLDSLLAGIDPDDAAELRDGVLALLRDGPRRSVVLVITMQRLGGPTATLGGFVGSTVLLGTANRQEHLLAGGESADWVDARRPGSAIWRGVTVQLCRQETGLHPRAGGRHAASRTVAPVDWHSSAVTLLVSSAPSRRADEILAQNTAEPGRPPVRVAVLGDATAGRITVADVRQSAGGPVTIVGDTDQWQAQFSLLTSLRENARIIVDGCTTAEFRAITRIRARPPLLDRVHGRAWLCSPRGDVTRISLEPASVRSTQPDRPPSAARDASA